jgi:predicted ABC-type sugar transport system permease subunit
MASDSDGPEPPEFPSHILLWPWAAPAFLVCVVLVGGLIGYGWNPHTNFPIVMVSFAVALIGGAIVLIIALPPAIRALVQFPSLRTPANLAATGMTVVFLLAIVFTGLCLYAAT